MHIVDWLPTLANLVGHEPKTEMRWDGVDQSPAIFEKRSAADREMYWVQKSRCKLCVLEIGKLSVIQKNQ